MSEYLHRLMCGDNTVICNYCKIDEDCWVFPANWWRCCVNHNLNDGQHEVSYHTTFCSHRCKNAYMALHRDKDSCKRLDDTDAPT